jgi:hypothetical protein
LKGKLKPCETNNIEEIWMNIKNSILEAAEESLGYNRKWLRTWNDELKQIIDEKKKGL